MRMKEKLLSVFLSAAMIISMAPTAVFADEATTDDTVVISEQSSETSSTENETVKTVEEEQITEDEEDQTAVLETEDISEEAELETADVAISASFDSEDMTVHTKYLDYTGTEVIPDVYVKNNDDEVLTKDKDYIVRYKNSDEDNAAPGIHILTVTGLGAYTDLTVDLAVNIKAEAFDTCDFTLSGSKFYYTGKAITPAVTVKNSTGTLILNKDYTVIYSNNTNTGTATVTVEGSGAYTGTKKLTFTIVKTAITKFKVALSKSKYAYTGKYLKPAVTVFNGTTKLSTANYTVSYKNNKKMGTATVTVKAKGNNISGTKTLTFKIVPAAAKLKSAKSVSNGIKLTWTKVSNATGYYVYRSVNGGTFKKIATTKSRSYTDKKTTDGKKYTYAIVSYKGKYTSVYSNKKEVLKKISKPVISSVKTNGSSLKIIWGKVSGAVSYELYRKSNTEDWTLLYKGTTRYFNDNTAVLNTTYSYKVKVIGSKTDATSATKSGKRTSGTSTNSTTLTLSVKQDTGVQTFYASWNKYTGATSYEIWWSKNSTFAIAGRHYGSTKNLHFEPQAAYVGTGTWYVKVRAITVKGSTTTYSKWSSTKTVTIK